MIRLIKVKEQQKENAEKANGKTPVKEQCAGELRLQKDMIELNLTKACTLSFPNGSNDLMNFEVVICPDDGYYLGGKFVFSFQVPSVYPHDAPKVKCKTKQPNHEDPLNQEAAAVLRNDPNTFKTNVRRAMAGGYVGQTLFSRCT